MAVRINGLDHVVLRTARRDDVLAFYRDKLGCPVERTLEIIGLYQLRAGATLIDVLDTTVYTVAAAGPGESLYDHFCIGIAADSVDEVLTMLDAAGIPHGEPAQRYGATGNGTSIYATDPDGRTVELKITSGKATEGTA
jgi:catechol 2,3-dioxygenase-like lactoylglutathione lyase family enzyme